MLTHDEITQKITGLNREYLKRHHAKEILFWETKMGISKDYDAFNKAEGRLSEFSSDMARLKLCRELAAEPQADAKQKETLSGWIRFFEANVIEDPQAQALSARIVELESKLALARNNMKLGYVDPDSGEFVPGSSVALSLKISTADDERVREACFHGLESIETFVMKNGFLEIVKERNRLARMLGYGDYYDYKVSTTEGFGRTRLFELLDDLELRTRDALKRYMEDVRVKHGEQALKPWNFRHVTTGDAVKDIDPYMQFEDALLRWGRSFAALGITYEKAVLQLDLIDRAGKYSNGFCHAPTVTFEDSEGRVRGEVNFTSNAVPGQMGSGKRAAETLFHEGGHAAHFSNMLMGAPCFSQEFAPTSAALAETQSMFLDSLLSDADWLTRYAKDRNGKSIPWEVIEKTIRISQPAKAYFIRSLLMICYAEKALYSMPEADLTPENVMAAFIEVERRLGILERCPRPTLAVPHLLSGEASCIYHGYVLAQAGVEQTRRYFLDTYGYISDNPAVGPRLRDVYWRPGNSVTFVDFIQRMSGRPFSMDDLVNDASLTIEEAIEQARASVKKLESVPEFTGKVELDAVIKMVHGAEVIASTENSSFEEAAAKYCEWVKSLGK